MRVRLAMTLLLVALIAAFGYLRDPPWLSGVESGLRGWETGTDGIRYRWTGGHASFFVPAAASAIAVPARTTFAAASDRPIEVTISVDDRPLDRFVLSDERWSSRHLSLPVPNRRSLRRVDVRVNRVRAGNRGVQLGEIAITR